LSSGVPENPQQTNSTPDAHPRQSALLPLTLLALAGLASRAPIIATPPVIPLLHDDFHMSEAQVGALIGLPLALFALMAVPGSLLVARLGARKTLIAGLAIAGVFSALRGAADNLWLLYAATIVMGGGVSIMQPALPRLVREWLPRKIGLGTAVFTNGMVTGATLGVALTPPLLGLLSNSWRLALIAWGCLALAITAVIAFSAPVEKKSFAALGRKISWWPNWRSPLPWILGLGFASNNSTFFALHAILPDYLSKTGRGAYVDSTLLWLNLSSLFGIYVLLIWAESLLHRAWPYVILGGTMFVGVLGLAFAGEQWLTPSSFLIGFASSIALGAVMALPPLLSAPDEAHLTAAGMFTIAYACAVVVPIISGALWDISGIAQLAFAPIALCTIALIVFGVIATRLRPAGRRTSIDGAP
jgi:CP family cyanate transporter-like MFS transporter